MHDFTRRALLQGGTALAATGALTGPALLNFAKAWAQTSPWKAEAGAKLTVMRWKRFVEAEDKAFWPLYRDYDAEMSRLGDERVALIAEYGRNYARLTDAVASTLGTKALDLEARRHAVKAKHYERIKAALSPRTALRFLQVEQQLLLIIDLQISAALPIVQ